MDERKFAALHKQFTSSSVADKERLTLVEMFAPFAYISCDQVGELQLRHRCGHCAQCFGSQSL